MTVQVASVGLTVKVSALQSIIMRNGSFAY